MTNAEQEIVDRLTAYLKFGQDKKNTNLFTTDYEVEARIDYHLQGKEDSAHLFWMPFNYKQVIVNKNYSLLLDKGDWSEGGAPKLDSCCFYLIHHLYFYSHIRDKIFEIKTIWIETRFTGQKALKFGKDGNSRKLHRNEKERMFG